MFAVFDIGGSKIRLAASENGETLGDVKILNTPQDFNEGINLIFENIRELNSLKNLKAICGGIAGVLDSEKTRLINSPNLAGWVHQPLKTELEDKLECSVYLENDAALAGLGEAAKGAGKNKKIVSYITIGTGIGGVRIINSRIDERSMGFEPGHQIINFDENYNPKYLEDYISGAAFKKRFNKNPEDINDEKIWDEAAKILAYGLNNTIVHWSPDIVILGGSMMKSTGIPMDKVKDYLRDALNIFPYIPPLEKSLFGDLSGLEGALIYLKQVSQST